MGSKMTLEPLTSAEDFQFAFEADLKFAAVEVVVDVGIADFVVVDDDDD